MNTKNKIYSNTGNIALLNLVDRSCLRLLDVGCGDGANARLLAARRPGIQIEGITHSRKEVRLATPSMAACFLADIEEELPTTIKSGFDTIMFSHVLEHVRAPESVIHKFVKLLKPSGQLLVAVPNLVSWRTRLRLLKGDFKYEEFGIFDNTHLRFFTYLTAESYLLSQCRNLDTVTSTVEGSVPLGPLRRLLPHAVCTWIDDRGCDLYPNLFGGQIILNARLGNE